MKTNHPLFGGQARLGTCMPFALLTLLSLMTQSTFAQSLGGAAPDAPVVAPAETFGTADIRPDTAPKPPELPPSSVLNLDLSLLPDKLLPPVDVAALLDDDARNESQGKVLRYGVGRDIALQPSEGQWLDAPGGGRLWLIEVTSEQAVGIRLHVTGLDLQPGESLWAYSLDQPERLFGPISGRGYYDSGAMWSPTLFGERVRIEFLSPASQGRSAPDRLPFSVDRLQHIYRDPAATVSQDASPRGGACHNDVTCSPTWTNTAKACAGIGYVNENSLFCSGQLIDTQNHDMTPYYLTANHCVSSSQEAQSSEIYWNYQSATCNGSPPLLRNVPQSAYCTLASGRSSSDYSLLLIDGALPTGLYWAGWTSTVVPNNQDSACIHHPSGTYKRISFGRKTNTYVCGGPNFIAINWYDGPTEFGSSGSGIFRADTQQLYGQLYCGGSSCFRLDPDDYGSFAVSYPFMSSLLQAGSDDALEDNDSCASPRTVSAQGYSGLVIKSTDEDWYRIAIPAGGRLDVNFTFTHTLGDIDAQLFRGCGGSPVAAANSGVSNEAFSYTNGGTAADFFLRVYLASDTRNTYNMVLNITGGSTTPPANDACASATPIQVAAIAFSNLNATNDGPAHSSCIQPGTSDSQVGSDIWYTYQAACTGDLLVSTCGAAGFNTKLAVYSNCGCSLSEGNLLGCNDDFSGCPGGSSRVLVPVQQGACYKIRIGGYQGAQGSGILTVLCTPRQSCADPGGGDVNGDGLIDGRDAAAFTAALLSGSPSPDALCGGDANGNQVLDAGDVPGMVSAILHR